MLSCLSQPLRELNFILLSMAGLSFLMSRGNHSEILPHLKFLGMKLTVHQTHDGTTRRLLGFSLDAELKQDNGSMLRDLAMLQHKDPLLDTHGHLAAKPRRLLVLYRENFFGRCFCDDHRGTTSTTLKLIHNSY